jgi:F-type H+-transporting ATPase subunit O
VQKLDDKLIKRLETAVSKSQYSQGKKMKVVTKVRVKDTPQPYPIMPLLHHMKLTTFFPNKQVSPDILGGLIVEIGDRTIDYSVASKISKMNKMLTDVV